MLFPAKTFVAWLTGKSMNVRVKRVYETPEAKDGPRRLVDRILPMGLSKEKAKITSWVKEIAPTTELRKEFAHRLENWDQFRSCYREELCGNIAFMDWANSLPDMVTLVFSASDRVHNNAVVLKEVLENYEDFRKSCRH